MVGAIRILVKVQSEVHLLDLLQGLAQLVQSSARWYIIPSGTVAGGTFGSTFAGGVCSGGTFAVVHLFWWHICSVHICLWHIWSFLLTGTGLEIAPQLS